MNIGFIGLGIMGKPMAKNLVVAGHDLVVYDIVKAPVDELVEMGAAAGKHPADVASRSEVIITMLPNSPHVREAVLGTNGIIEGVRKGQIYVDMSSIAPGVSIELAGKLAEKGVEMLDAPVSGGEPKAIEGTIAIMAGGDEGAFERVKEILLIMGASAVLVGGIGSGNTTKLANQIIVALNIAAMSEAMVLAQKAGVDPEKVYNAIRGGLAGSTVLDAKVPLVLDGNFKPGFRIELHIKDLINALETAHEVDAPIPLTASVLEMMTALRSDGKGKDDHGGLIQYYEKAGNTKVRRKKSDS